MRSVAEITPVGFATIGWQYYIVYVCINWFLILPCKHGLHRIWTHIMLTRFLALYFFYSETNDRHLEEVDQIFGDSAGIFDRVRVARGLPAQAFAYVELPAEKTKTEHIDSVKDTKRL